MINQEDSYLRELERVKRYSPSDGDNLLGMEMDFHAGLSGLDQLDPASVSVRRTDDPDGLLIAEGAAAPGVSLEDAAQAVLRCWLGDLGYPYSEAHHLTILKNKAVLRFVTQIGPGGFYVSGKISVIARRRVAALVSVKNRLLRCSRRRR